MIDEKKDLESLEQLFAAGDAWLRKYGIVSKIAHNSIVTNLYVAFPKVRYLEYFLPEDSSKERKVWVRLYVPFWKLLLVNREKMVDEVIFFLREYLSDYDIKVELKRYKKGVEKSNEIPKEAHDHVVAPGELQPDTEPSRVTTDSPVPTESPRSDDTPSDPVTGT